ncbi:helix-turn-helix transcriptional regulator [Herbivorax sp. ANBcel31]|uniref:helix-turn-helix domain-containing protein n=1 Tax=Herbivorax sp. ANBcel31 TaxID=3069754 RepID=UPI0027B7C641|nr:helix-turn-helix transcriptional regulator [Herbivorax sp. ANBcel31]MDQ2087404.1 helix-turn-helix transcriptional regulator [Herbivorax sp. ANBcel31]
MAFSTMIKQLREEKGLSQKDIAEYLGITRQAIASYELAKREPDYEILHKLADYFGVSADYLLGRSNCRDVNAVTVGKNIDLIKGGRTYQELSQDISDKLGTLIFPEMLELYAKGERMPFIGTIKILAKYAQVRDSFFYTYNTVESYEEEKKLYSIEVGQEKLAETNEQAGSILDYIKDKELIMWLTKETSLPYIKLAKEIEESGLAVDALKPLLDSISSTHKNIK